MGGFQFMLIVLLTFSQSVYGEIVPQSENVLGLPNSFTGIRYNVFYNQYGSPSYANRQERLERRSAFGSKKHESLRPDPYDVGKPYARIRETESLGAAEDIDTMRDDEGAEISSESHSYLHHGAAKFENDDRNSGNPFDPSYEDFEAYNGRDTGYFDHSGHESGVHPPVKKNAQQRNRFAFQTESSKARHRGQRGLRYSRARLRRLGKKLNNLKGNRLRRLRKKLYNLKNEFIFNRRLGQSFSHGRKGKKAENRHRKYLGNGGVDKMRGRLNSWTGKQKGRKIGKRRRKALPMTCSCKLSLRRGGVCYDLLPGREPYCKKRPCGPQYICVAQGSTGLTCIRRKKYSKIVNTGPNKCASKPSKGYMYVPYA